MLPALSEAGNQTYTLKEIVYLTSSCVNWGFLARVGQFKTRVKRRPRVPKNPNLHMNELNTTFFLFDEALKDCKSLKIFKISLTFRFDKL
jgi:hypothetical protein